MFERCLYFNINAVARKVNRIWEQSFQEYGLSPAHAYLLRFVLANPGVSQQEIASELELEKSTITRFIDSLEKRRYLRRLKSGREQLVYPTQSAKVIHEPLEKQGNDLYKMMIKSLGRDSLVSLVGQLRETGKRLE